MMSVISVHGSLNYLQKTINNDVLSLFMTGSWTRSLAASE